MDQDNRSQASALKSGEFSAGNAPLQLESPPPRKRKGIAWSIALILISLALAFTWRWYQHSRLFVSTDDATIEADRLAISSRIIGRVVYLGAGEGDTVNAGRLLARLDVNDLSAQQAQARAGLAVANANVRLAQVTLDRARSDLERMRVQYQNQTVTEEQFTHAQQDYDAGRARLAVAEAQVGTAQAQISLLDTSLANATVISPTHGVVSRKWVMEGDVVQPGQPIYSLYNLDSVWVTANLEETKLRRIRPGDSVQVRVDAYPKRDFTGRIAWIGSNTAAQFSLIPPNNAAGNFTKVTQRVPVRIALVNRPADARLLPGMSVVVKVRI